MNPLLIQEVARSRQVDIARRAERAPLTATSPRRPRWSFAIPTLHLRRRSMQPIPAPAPAAQAAIACTQVR